MTTDLVSLAEASVAAFGARPLFGECGDGEWRWLTYAAWQRDVDALRAGLAALGVARGDRVAIISRNSAAWATAAYATYGLGATFVPMYEAQRPEDWELVLADCGAAVVVCRTPEIASSLSAMAPRLPAVRDVLVVEAPSSSPRSLRGLMDRAARPVAAIHPRGDEVAGFIYTSGTTGRPKGVMLTHGNLTSNVQATVSTFPIGADDRTVSFLPWAHVYGQVCELHILIAVGASTAFNTSTEHLLDDLRTVRPTILIAVPRIFNKLHATVTSQIEREPRLIRAVFQRGLAASTRRRRGERLGLGARLVLLIAGLMFAKVRRKLGGRLRYAISGSATLSREVAELIDALGIDVYEGYGLTETSPIVAFNRPGQRKFGSVGLPISDVTIEIDATRGELPGEGEIVVHGPNVMKGYHAQAEETARTLTADGGLRTGDLGHVDADGYLFITGRLKEQYKLENGKYVMPSPLEERLALSPFVTQVMLHGSGHPYNVALVAIEPAAIAAWAGERGIEITDATKDERVRALIQGELDREATAFRGYERPRAYLLVDQQFTVENGLLTPTLKLKRREVLARYGRALEALYASPVIAPVHDGRAALDLTPHSVPK